MVPVVLVQEVSEFASEVKFSCGGHARVSSTCSTNTTATNDVCLQSESSSDEMIEDSSSQVWHLLAVSRFAYQATPVRNTFIDFPLTQPKLRRVLSAPSRFTAFLVEPVPRCKRTSVLDKEFIVTHAVQNAVDSPSLPTLGSTGHNEGRCRPCAFAWKPGGCQNGTQCAFCHLCDAGERKFRKREVRLERIARKTFKHANRRD